MKSKQGDTIDAFLHAKLEENEKVFVNMPKGFEQYDKRGNQRLIRSKNTLYGLLQSPRDFWKYLTHKLITIEMLQYNLDPWLFIIDKFLCIVYVDDLIFWAKDKSDINDLVMKLCGLGLDTEQEEDATVFLGFILDRNEETRLLYMKQPGLIDCVMNAVGLDNGTDKGSIHMLGLYL